MKNNIVKMKLTKSTKNTHVYGSDEEDTPIPTLYIKKHAFSDSPPETITVSVEHE